MHSTKKQTRVAGLLYLVLAIPAPIGLICVPSKLIVSGDATATAGRIRASQSLLRLGIASELFTQIMVIFLVLALHRLFKVVNETFARQLVILGGVGFRSVGQFAMVLELGELPIIFWRLIWGARVAPSDAPAS